jgi:hypothetical protein
MDEMKVLLRAIETLQPDLPNVVGAGWPEFQKQLNAYLDQFQQNRERAPILRAQILALFGTQRQAHQRLIEVTARYRKEESEHLNSDLQADGPYQQTTRGSARRRTSAGERNVTRYTDIVCARRVWIKTPRVPVVVRLTTKFPAYSALVEEMSLREDLPVQVRIEAPFFEILNAPRQDLTILPDQDSPPIVFDIRPLQAGHTDITLDFFQNGNPVGVATVAVEVTPYEIAEGAESQPIRSLQVEPDLAPPDIVLHIAWNQASSALQFTLIQDGGASWNDGFRPIPINGNPATLAAQFYRQITSLVSNADPTVEAVLKQQLQIPIANVDRQVKLMGQNLWRDLIPDELKALYGRERKSWRNRTMLVFSDEPHIPWELVWPYEASAWEDEGPWCQILRLTRWLRKDERGNGNDKAPGRVPAIALVVLAPTYSLLNNLPSAQPERQMLLDLILQHKLRDLSPAVADWATVMNLLEAGGYDWVHVASHGNFYPEAPDGDSALWLQRDNALTPQHIAGMQIEGYLRQHRPVFFLNACEVGRQGWAVTRIGGWANRLISCGVGLFVGPLWSVGDSSALTFATAFYQSLFSGETVASATQQARAAARQVGDPTYLAYSVYGHPNARVATG